MVKKIHNFNYTGFESCINDLKRQYQIKSRRIIIADRKKELNVILKPEEYLKNIKVIRSNLKNI